MTNINNLYHFTNINNLESILKFGLLSVEYMNKHNIKHIKNDINRFDNQLNMISISANKINNKMLYRKERNKSNLLDIYIVLEIDINILNYHNIKKYYCYKNAASNEINHILKNNKDILTTIESLDNFILSEDPQKEILINEKINLSFITKIIVKNTNDYELVNYILKKNHKNIPIILNQDIYNIY